MQSTWKIIAMAVAMAALTSALALLAIGTTSLSDLNSWTYDFTVNRAGFSGTADSVVLVDFDEETFQRIHQYPVPRSTFAEVITRIGRQKPRVIGLDLFLSEWRSPAEDAAMQKALTDAEVVIVASQASGGNLPPVTPLPLFCEPEDAGAASGFCKEGKPGALGYAFVNLPLDSDGFVRQASLFSGGRTPAISFPLMLAQQYTGRAIEPVDARRASFNGHSVFYASPLEKTFLIGAWSPHPLRRVPAWRVLAGEIPPDTFTNRLILIGQSSDAARDLLFTPVFRRAGPDGTRLRSSGTEVLGAAARSLIEGRVVERASKGALWCYIFAWCIVAALAMLLVRLGPNLSIVTAALLLSCLASLLLFAKMRFWLPFLPAQLGMAFTVPTALAVQFVQQKLLSRESLAMREQLMSLFSRYVDPEVAKTIWKHRDKVSLTGEECCATVVFTDIRSFTALSAGQPPALVLSWLNEYLTAMDEVIREHGGFLNKFIGDGLMIVFCVPLTHGIAEDARRAVSASLAMLKRVERLNRDNAGSPTHPSLRIGIGIHTGPLMAGTIGSALRQEYSVIGETVNLASRLESLNKQFNTDILLSSSTYKYVHGDFTGFEPLGEAKVSGFDKPVPVYTMRVEKTAELAADREVNV